MCGDYFGPCYPIWYWSPPFQTQPVWRYDPYPNFPVSQPIYEPIIPMLTPEEIAEVRKLIEKKNESA